jgi:hypothetical protein
LAVRSDLYTEQSLVWAVGDTGGNVPPRAKVTLGNDAPIDITRDDPITTNQDTCPAAAALLWVDSDGTAFVVLVHSAGQTGVDAGRVRAMTTLHRQEHAVGPLHADPRHWPRLFFLEPLHQVLRGGMGKSAVDLAETASHANLLVHIY